MKTSYEHFVQYCTLYTLHTVQCTQYLLNMLQSRDCRTEKQCLRIAGKTIMRVPTMTHISERGKESERDQGTRVLLQLAIKSPSKKISPLKHNEKLNLSIIFLDIEAV